MLIANTARPPAPALGDVLRRLDSMSLGRSSRRLGPSMSPASAILASGRRIPNGGRHRHDVALRCTSLCACTMVLAISLPVVDDGVARLITCGGTAAAATASRLPHRSSVGVVYARAVHLPILSHVPGGLTLNLLSAMNAVGTTPLGPSPFAPLGCSVAAPRCRCRSSGCAVANPPPLVSWGVSRLLSKVLPLIAWPRSRSCRRLLRGNCNTAPSSWSPATCGQGHGLGVRFIFAP